MSVVCIFACVRCDVTWRAFHVKSWIVLRMRNKTHRSNFLHVTPTTTNAQVEKKQICIGFSPTTAYTNTGTEHDNSHFERSKHFGRFISTFHGHHTHMSWECLRVFVLLFSMVFCWGGFMHMAHVRVFPSVLRKAFATFLFHLNQSAHEFFFKLHEVGSIYGDMCVHSTPAWVYQMRERESWSVLCATRVYGCVRVCDVERVSLENKYFAHSDKWTPNTRCRCELRTIYSTFAVGDTSLVMVFAKGRSNRRKNWYIFYIQISFHGLWSIWCTWENKMKLISAMNMLQRTRGNDFFFGKNFKSNFETVNWNGGNHKLFPRETYILWRHAHFIAANCISCFLMSFLDGRFLHFLLMQRPSIKYSFRCFSIVHSIELFLCRMQ